MNIYTIASLFFSPVSIGCSCRVYNAAICPAITRLHDWDHTNITFEGKKSTRTPDDEILISPLVRKHTLLWFLSISWSVLTHESAMHQQGPFWHECSSKIASKELIGRCLPQVKNRLSCVLQNYMMLSCIPSSRYFHSSFPILSS